MKKILVFALVFGLLACKDKSVDPVATTTLEKLTGSGSKTWKLVEGVATKGSLEVNLIASQNPCLTDNLINLKSDFSYEFTEGATKCSPSDPDVIVSANWSISADEKQLSVSKFIFLNRTVDNPVFTITEITDQNFVGTTSVVLDGETYGMTVKFEVVK